MAAKTRRMRMYIQKMMLHQKIMCLKKMHILKYLHGSAACSDYIAKDIQDILALKGADDSLLVHDVLFLYIVKVLKLEFLECSLVCLIIPVNS